MGMATTDHKPTVWCLRAGGVEVYRKREDALEAARRRIQVDLDLERYPWRKGHAPRMILEILLERDLVPALWFFNEHCAEGRGQVFVTEEEIR